MSRRRRRARRAVLDDADLGRGPRHARRDAARPHPHPVGQPAADPARPDQELVAARYIADLLTAEGLRPEIVEPVPAAARSTSGCAATARVASRSCCCRTSTSCPAPPERWSHDPFAAEIADGYVYGRGAVDMKDMIAMELGVVRLLAAEARAAGLDPARDPIPGLRRDVLFTCTADEEAGGDAGAKWIAEHRPDWLRRPARVNECGGVSIDGRPAAASIRSRSRRRASPPTGSASAGTWGHGSMPRADNAAVLAAGDRRATGRARDRSASRR